MVTLFTVVLLATALERVAELALTLRNARWAAAHGGVEHGRAHYPFMVGAHAAMLAGALAEVHLLDRDPSPWLALPMLVLVLLAQGLRWWCVVTLGARWTTRVVVVPGMPLVRSGPYRWLRHPNYVAVTVEGAALPLLGGAWVTALVFTVVNAVLLVVRVRVEDAALAGSTEAPAAPTR